MSLPANWSTVTVTGTYLNVDGEPLKGTVAFSTTTRVVDAGANVTVPPGVHHVSLDKDGTFSVVLPATDDPDVAPTGFTYRVDENLVLPSGGRSLATYLILLPAATPTVDLADVVPVTAVAEVSPYLRAVDLGTVVETPAGAQAKVDALGVRVTAVETTGLAVTNLAGLKRWAAARGAALIRPVTITVLGDSISWGAGADDTSGSATPEATARARAWCTQLRKRLNSMWGLPDAEGWVSVRSGFGQSGLTTSGAGTSGTTGPLGSNGGGGMSVASGQTATFTPPSSLGVFTELDVWHWGPDAGVSSPNSPTIIVDGATLATSAAVASGNLLRTTVTGLSSSTHTVQITRATAGNVYFFAVTARNSTGFVTNRIAISGSTTDNIDGGQTGQAAQRLIDSAVMRGFSDLVVIALGTNDQGSQIPLATYQANLQATIDAAVAGGSAVLLLGEPPDSTPTAGITEDQYREVMRQLALANTHVTYVDLRSLFGTASEVDSNTYGLFGALFTVHPSAKGHGFMANALVDLLTLPRYA